MPHSAAAFLLVYLRKLVMPFDVDAVRARFPALAIRDQDRSRVYLDNPAGTQVPQSVIDATVDTLVSANANLGGHFPTTIAAGAIVEQAIWRWPIFSGLQVRTKSSSVRT